MTAPETLTALRLVADQLVAEHGWEIVDDRDRILSALDTAGLLSAADAPDELADRDAVDFVSSHARWLLS